LVITKPQNPIRLPCAADLRRDPIPKLLGGLEDRNLALRNLDGLARSRIAGFS
jgi:hypothetical protein